MNGLDFAVTTSCEEDLATLNASLWETSVFGTTELERRTIAPPTSVNTVEWKIERKTVITGWRVWRDGQPQLGRYFDTSVRLHSGDRLIFTLNLNLQ